MADFKRSDELQSLAVTTSWPRRDVCVVQLAGDLDVGNTPELTEYLRKQTAGGPTHLLLDLAAVTFLSAAGITLIVNAQRNNEGIHGQLHVVGTTDNSMVERVLHLTGLHVLLSDHDDHDDHDDVEHALRRIDGLDRH